MTLLISGFSILPDVFIVVPLVVIPPQPYDKAG